MYINYDRFKNTFAAIYLYILHVGVRFIFDLEKQLQ